MRSIHICFANDLLMFYRADRSSIRPLNASFQRFSRASSLQANVDKSSLYIGGVADQTRQEILDELGFTAGTLPFRYLGVPFASKKLNVSYYMPLIEKITARVTCWSAKLTFLWTGVVSVSKKALVAWETVYLPYVVGGLNVINFCLWNKTAILNYYIKGEAIDTVPIPKNASWVLRKILAAMEFFIQAPTYVGDLSVALNAAQ
ncbi:uncharacterized protein LOC132628680 [Lycium barbarum]|uniref:uncharacterized protein LOC132628680 n=1 Tax=Lycium barbarum TaxID=112863 RepID=UPI00293F517E|nr:uncharacterized protein LOC132628680 [Lycium barbarum]